MRTSSLCIQAPSFIQLPILGFGLSGYGFFLRLYLSLLTKAALMASGQRNSSTLQKSSTVVLVKFGVIWCFVSSRETRTRYSLRKN
ncbi:hypothetical protein RvY_16609-2 [Ramazzottius varieornatus]|uniref:Uncharacterized protein n=1 Tax=Ramazzottius varieornatus TaxID=947166 RepID=A0A1D1W5F4_RAMVA|nr:hypothetical protein RvY_16609-2 [Ramazzottius varieornatus]